MKEIIGDLWDYYSVADAICITTNGVITRNERLVMGRGCASEAKNRFPDIDRIIGELVIKRGNHCYEVGNGIISFPTKHHWRDNSNINLIEQSAKELKAIADKQSYEMIVIPRPGCGHGNLSWHEVRKTLSNILDDRFFIISKT